MILCFKLDLSKLTDEEAKHVWDFRHKSQVLHSKHQHHIYHCNTGLQKSYCIRCLKPFKFLVNNKFQCLDCGLSVCKSCSRYNKKDLGWVCDPCHMTRYNCKPFKLYL
uniref:FYVE-type zinc finger domain-containing protein n=1 Tax=Neogobius melanostomus TaxID=47308 RepID=A0A8C6WMP5_9GOBI